MTHTSSPMQPIDPTKDKRINAPFYGVAPCPIDNSIWGSVLGMPGALVRSDAGIESAGDGALSEIYEVPWNNPEGAPHRASRRAGWTWTATASCGRCSRADTSPASIAASAKGRSTGRPQPASTAPKAGRSIRSRDRTIRVRSDSGSADSAYYDFVDRFDMLGMGKDVPLATGNGSEALLALVDGKFLTFRVPYPMGFYAKGIDGRIDNPNEGWKGKGVYSTRTRRAPRSMLKVEKERPASS